MAGVVWLAIALPQTIWRLFEIKLELLCQIAPSIFLGIHLRSLSAKSILTGILLGTAVALFIMIGNWAGLAIDTKPWGVHAGVWGLMVNFAAIGTCNYFMNDTARNQTAFG